MQFSSFLKMFCLLSIIAALGLPSLADDSMSEDEKKAVRNLVGCSPISPDVMTKFYYDEDKEVFVYKTLGMDAIVLSETPLGGQ